MTEREPRREKRGESAHANPWAEFWAKAHRQLAARPQATRPTAEEPNQRLLATAPSLSRVEPPAVATEGGARVVIHGDNFVPGCTLELAGNALEAERLSFTEIRAQAPAHPAGEVALRITNPDGQRGDLPAALRFEERPAVLHLEPPRASVEGGVEIAVVGRHFQPGCTVSLLAQHSPAVHYDGPERIRFVAPRHESPESGVLRVTNPSGLRSAEEPSFFYVRTTPPTIAAVEPTSGSTAGGKRVVVSGSDFQPGCEVRLGAVPATVVRGDEAAIEVSVPAATEPGTVDVAVTNPDGQVATLPAAFTYELPPAPPKIIAVSPARDWCAGGTRVVVTGDNFDDETVVRIGEVQCSIEQLTRTELVAITPPHESPEAVAVEVVNRERVPVRLEAAFAYEQRPAPRIEDLEPSSGPTTGGTRLTIEGAHLGSDVTVRIGRQRAEMLRAQGSSALVVVTPPQRSPGLADLVVTGPDGASATRPKAFRYEAAPAPTIASVAPNRCGTEGGSVLTIEGKGFVAATAVLLGREVAKVTKVIDGESIEVRLPAGKHGAMEDVTVKNPDGKQAVSRRAFQYDERYD